MRIVKTIPEPKDLPPGSLPWSRAVVQAVGDVENKMASAATEQDAAMKGIASTLDALSRQVSDLQERAIYSAEEVYSSGEVPYNVALPWNSGVRSLTPFTLKTKRKVLVSLLWSYSIDLSYNGASPAFFVHADIHFDMFINGSRWTYRSIEAFSEQAIVGQGSHLVQTGTMHWWDIIEFPPGSHTAGTRVETVAISSSDGDFVVYSPKVTVQVMEAVE